MKYLPCLLHSRAFQKGFSINFYFCRELFLEHLSCLLVLHSRAAQKVLATNYYVLIPSRCIQGCAVTVWSSMHRTTGLASYKVPTTPTTTQPTRIAYGSSRLLLATPSRSPSTTLMWSLTLTVITTQSTSSIWIPMDTHYSEYAHVQD